MVEPHNRLTVDRMIRALEELRDLDGLGDQEIVVYSQGQENPNRIYCIDSCTDLRDDGSFSEAKPTIFIKECG